MGKRRWSRLSWLVRCARMSSVWYPGGRIALSRRHRAMPLHDWTELTGWDGVHHIWIVELLYWVKPRLPAGYRAYIGTTPTFAVEAPPEERPDVGVHGSR